MTICSSGQAYFGHMILIIVSSALNEHRIWKRGKMFADGDNSFLFMDKLSK